MMNKQNHNPWARWKALLFIPLAALLVQAFARPEINRESEQISTFKGTEILQTNTGWNEEKFLEELRKSLPAGVSRELSYEDTWKEIVKTYQFEQRAPIKTGIVIMINKNSKLLVVSDEISQEFPVMEEIPGLMAKNFAKKGKPASPIIIDGKEVDKIIRYTLIQRDMNTLADDYQQLYQTVGEAYMQKRDEIARQYYQTGYNALDTEKKSVIDNVAPILVMIDVRGSFAKPYPDRTQMVTEEDDVAFEKIDNSQITYNSQLVKVKELYELIKKDTNGKVGMAQVIMNIISDDTEKKAYNVDIWGDRIDPENPEYYYNLNGKWVYEIKTVKIDKIRSIDTYSPSDAVKKYGDKAKNGAIAIITK